MAQKGVSLPTVRATAQRYSPCHASVQSKLSFDHGSHGFLVEKKRETFLCLDIAAFKPFIYKCDLFTKTGSGQT
jgi:hypothetical protein